MGKASGTPVRISSTDEGWKRCSGGRVFHYLINNQTLCGKKGMYVSGNYWDQIGNWPRCQRCVAIYNAAEKGGVMPAYNFRAEFAEAVESGRKTHTIRRPRKRPTRPGDRLKLYTGQRTRECRLLREVTCTRVTPVWIHCCVIYLDDRRLGYPEADELAVADGFTDFTEMNAFFERLYGPSVDLELIEWEVVTR